MIQISEAEFEKLKRERRIFLAALTCAYYRYNETALLHAAIESTEEELTLENAERIIIESFPDGERLIRR